MEERDLNIVFNKSGRGSYSPRISLPMEFIKAMGIPLVIEDGKALKQPVKVKFDGERIIIENVKVNK